MRHRTGCARAAALAHVDAFCRNILPGTIRRIAIWKALPRRTLAEWHDDLRHELVVDCLENAALVAALPPPARHSRWMRRVERWIYRQQQGHRRFVDLDEELVGAAAAPQVWPDVTAPATVKLANGRPNLARSARHNGLTLPQLRQQFAQLAERLGRGTDYFDFWRRRAAEAMVGLAADLLRARGGLHLYPRPRPAPDPEQRLRRLRRLAERFLVHPSTREVRGLLRPYRRGRRFGAQAPRQLCEAAIRLKPEHGAAWLWLFEACAAHGDLPAAARALRAARRAAAPAVAVVLARARLCEQRGRWPAAVALLRRAAARCRTTARAVAALGTLTMR